MRIRSLEITGFKSFADRTVLAFDRGISAIVGPNGCGKSNVVDAIRWVMGEQNPRHLRGRVMEDVIFSGTESTPAVGLAEVVLTLDNSDGRAAGAYSGFSEIQIARRLYRSGESEYLINKVPCRLRDVLDFFMDTGIGVRGYTIVEQGQIAAIVSNRPDERRVIFEEAAGIGKYRQRRRESERKLAATEQNLLRVRDIIGELQRQISSLERQARKAKRYKELSARLRDLELRVSWEEYRADAERLREVEREHEGLRLGASRLDAEVARAEADLEAESRAHLDREKELQRQSEALYALRSEIQSLESRLEYERREREGLIRLADERGGEIAELEERLSADTGALTETLEELSRIEEQLVRERARFEERERRLAERREQLAVLHGRRDASQEELLRLSSEHGSLASRAETLDERRRELELRLSEVDEAIDARGREIESLRQEELSSGATLSRALEEKDELGRRLAELLRSQQQAGAALERLRAEHGSLRVRLQQISTRLESLREAERLESTRLRETLQRMPAGHRERVRGVLAELLRVEDGFEPAVEAVLGARTGALLVDDPADALELLAWFRKAAAGRATLLATGSDRGDGRGFVPMGRPLLERVHPPSELVGVMERLLGDVYVVEDLAEPVRRYGVTHPPATFVTPAGDLLDRSGALSGGERAPGAVSRAGAIRRLESEVCELEKLESELGAAASAEAERGQQLLGDVENTRSRHHTAELAVVNIEKDLERVRERGKATLQLLADERGLRQQITERIERVGVERVELDAHLEVIERDRAALGAARAQLSEEIGERSRDLETLERRLTQDRIELAAHHTRRDQLGTQRDRLQQAVREGQAWLARRRDEIRSARERGESLQRTGEQVSEILTRKLHEEEELRRAQGELRRAYEQSQRSLGEARARVRARVSEREATREKLGSSELAVQEASLRRNQLVERILERYGVDLQQYTPPAETVGGDERARREELADLRQRLAALGDVHLGAIEEHEEVAERHRYLSEQKADLELSIERLRSAIARINRTSRARFRETFEQVNEQFQKIFPRLFRGGRARLALTEAEEILEAGIEISAQPPGKRLQNVNLLSGGEKSLTALALLIAVFVVKPSPFFLLDEVDAALDDANVERFNELLHELADRSQFLLITHNKGTIEIADTLFGVTMQEAGLSKLVTVDLVS
ncbi:MAG: chromosome segregation protein SMC [Myxococcota bacterium]